MRRNLLFAALLLYSFVPMSAQIDKKELRKGNREYRKEEYRKADISYRKALVKDSTSFAANYNLACNEYRMQEGMEDAINAMQRIQPQAESSGHASDYFYNLGDYALAQKDYKTAVDAFKASLLNNPSDLDAKENYVYAKLMLENQQQNQDQNQNQNQNQDQNQDRQNQNQDQQNQDQNQDRQNQDQQDQRQNQDQPKISPQAAQQMLQAIQAKEKETQEKVNKEKAQALKSRQKEKNW